MQVLVVGAGVVGLAVARAAARNGHEVIVAEATKGIGNGVSSRNSEVIHGGMYYPTGSLRAPVGVLRPNHLAVVLVEGWRGEICHVALTDAHSRFARYKIVDPSFHNWMGLALALRDEQISDFPLCNKSFNLSYCGHDL